MTPRGVKRVHIRFLIVVLSAVQFHGVCAQPGNELQNNSYGYLANFNSSMAIVVVFLVCTFFLMGFFSVYLRRCADAHATARSGAPATSRAIHRPRGLDPTVIETFPIFVFSAVKSLKIGKGSLECAVCLSEFEDSETLRLLPKCSHVFHPDCIDAWLASHVTCPVCRSKLSPESSETTAVSCTQLNEEETNVREGSFAPHDRASGFVDPDHAVVINVDEIQLNLPARTRIVARLPRSHSTGHSLVRVGECTERFTLRLPEEVRKQLTTTGNLKRCSSYDVVLPTVGSSRNGKTCSDRQTGRSEPSPWAFSVTPPFFSRGNCSVESPKGGGYGTREIEGVFGKTSLRSVSVPFDCRNVKGEKVLL